VVLTKKNHPSLKQFLAAYIVPCKDNIDQNPGPLSKSFWGLLKKVSGHEGRQTMTKDTQISKNVFARAQDKKTRSDREEVKPHVEEDRT